MTMTSKVVAITGGFGNLGVAVGRRFAAGSWHVALIDRVERPSSDTESELAGHLLLGSVDITDFDVAKRAIDAALSRYQRLDALINIAGGFRWETLQEGDLATWDHMYRMNLRTAATMSKAAVEHLVQSGNGRIVNIAAAAATKAARGMGAYTASKAGVMRLTEATAEELKHKSVTVNAILPGIIDTPQNRKDMPDADFSRWVAPASLAEVIFFLASDAARDITGALIPVTGRL